VVAKNAESLKSSGKQMIKDDQELDATLERIRHFQDQLAHLRKTETNPTNYRLSSSGFIAEIDRMQLEVREYLSSPASPVTSSA
jgi:hypothetical protein